jgi:NAD(P)-dependent dehydrogenase (short-subunit alcohol dehydrogenase family)
MATMTFHPDGFRGRVFGVTGAAHGIGEATVRLLASLGANVLAIDKDEKNIARLKGDVKATWFCADVGDEGAMEGAIEEVATAHGRFDGWVNNAMYAKRGMIDRQPKEEMDLAWGINVMVPWKVARWLMPYFKRGGGGSIVNISSIHAHQTTAGASAYVASKAALEGLTRAMAVELGPMKVRVNAVVPGFILTYAGCESRQADPILAKKEEELRFRIEEIEGLAHQPWPVNGLPSDVANLVAFLLSDASAFITGASIPIDGGELADVRSPTGKISEAHAELEKCRRGLRELGLSPDVTY